MSAVKIECAAARLVGTPKIPDQMPTAINIHLSTNSTNVGCIALKTASGQRKIFSLSDAQMFPIGSEDDQTIRLRGLSKAMEFATNQAQGTNAFVSGKFAWPLALGDTFDHKVMDTFQAYMYERSSWTFAINLSDSNVEGEHCYVLDVFGAISFDGAMTNDQVLMKGIAKCIGRDEVKAGCSADLNSRGEVINQSVAEQDEDPQAMD